MGARRYGLTILLMVAMLVAGCGESGLPTDSPSPRPSASPTRAAYPAPGTDGAPTSQPVPTGTRMAYPAPGSATPPPTAEPIAGGSATPRPMATADAA